MQQANTENTVVRTQQISSYDIKPLSVISQTAYAVNVNAFKLKRSFKKM